MATRNIRFGMRRYPLAMLLFSSAGAGFCVWSQRISKPTFVFPFGTLDPESASTVLMGVGVMAIVYCLVLSYMRFVRQPVVSLGAKNITIPLGEFASSRVTVHRGEVLRVRQEGPGAGGWRTCHVEHRGGTFVLRSSQVPSDDDYFAMFSVQRRGNRLQLVVGEAHKPPADDRMAVFVAKVLHSTETTWEVLFRESGKHYQQPKLVLFSGSTPTACGAGQAAMGPFYCPGDRQVYIDLAFYQDLKDRFKAPGEFAEAYVIAHEVGHHVQNLLGISGKVHAAQQRAHSKAQANALSVRLELQADCFAGVWGKRADSMRHILEPGELQQALQAATAIGDDKLQQQARGVVVPESFTHGSSEQRVRWFSRGFESGDLSGELQRRFIGGSASGRGPCAERGEFFSAHGAMRIRIASASFAASAILCTNATKSAFLETKSVSQLTHTI